MVLNANPLHWLTLNIRILYRLQFLGTVPYKSGVILSVSKLQLLLCTIIIGVNVILIFVVCHFTSSCLK